MPLLPHSQSFLMGTPQALLFGVRPLGARVGASLSLPRQPLVRPSARRILLELHGSTPTAGRIRLRNLRVPLGHWRGW